MTAEILRAYGDRRLELLAEIEEVRLSLADAIRTAAAEGMRQVDIVRASGYTREQVRMISAGRTGPVSAERVA